MTRPQDEVFRNAGRCRCTIAAQALDRWRSPNASEPSISKSSSGFDPNPLFNPFMLMSAPAAGASSPALVML